MKGLQVSGITKSFGPNRVLRGVDLEVSPGSLTAILGSSGSGKTTLLRVIAGFERPDEGRVVLGTEPVDDAPRRFVPTERRRIGYVPQEGALFPNLSAARNVAFGLPRGRRRTARVVELLELVGLRGLGPRYPHQLSGGQQQRVALARALAIEPEIVLLDEPFTSLDAAMRASLRADVLEVLRRAGTTSILVTHDQEEALSMADEVAVLRGGSVVQLGAPPQLYENPGDEELAQFLGESNVVPGKVHDGQVSTGLGTLAVRSWSGPPGGGAARVLVRPEQIDLVTVELGQVMARVTSSEYFGHDTVVRVRPECGGLPELVVRVTGGIPLEPGHPVGLRARGSVTAWPADSQGTETVGAIGADAPGVGALAE